MEERIQAAEMWFLRQITWRSHTPIEEVLKKANTERWLLSTIKRRQNF